jgi:hypothetical protein
MKKKKYQLIINIRLMRRPKEGVKLGVCRWMPEQYRNRGAGEKFCEGSRGEHAYTNSAVLAAAVTGRI